MTYEVLKGVMKWQSKASLMIPDWHDYYNKEFHSSAYTYPDNQLFDSAKNFGLAAFRNKYYLDAKDVIKQRNIIPFNTPEIVQNILIFPLRGHILNISSYLDGGFESVGQLVDGYRPSGFSQSYIGSPAFDLFLKGPAIYTAHSEYYTVIHKEGNSEIRIILILSKSEIPLVLKFEKKLK